MKLLLISPEGEFSTKEKLSLPMDYTKMFEAYHFVFDGIGTALPLIAALTPEGYFDEIRLIDENHKTVDFEEEADLVGITAMTQQATRAYEIADRFRERGIPVVLGGHHPTVLPEEAKAHADTVIVGEAEEVWRQYIADFASGHPEPFYVQKERVELTGTPVPRYDLLDMNDYRLIYVEACRGCIRNCDFCASARLYGPGLKAKRIEQVVEELKTVKRLMKIPMIAFADDNMLLDRTYGKTLLRAMIPLNVRWVCSCDISIADDEELLDLMYESGNFSVFIGFEAVDESVGMISRWKLKQLKRVSEAIEKIQSKGLGIFASFVVGLDTHDASVFKTIEQFMMDNHLFGFHLSIMTPFPGTPLWDRLKKEGRLLNRPWSKYNLWDVVYRPKLMIPRELQERQVEMLYRRFFGPEAERRNKEKVRYFKEIFDRLKKEGKARPHS